MKQFDKKVYVIAVQPSDGFDCEVKGWDGKSQVYYQSAFKYTIDIDKAKKYASQRGVNYALKAIRFFQRNRLCYNATIYTIRISMRQDIVWKKECNF